MTELFSARSLCRGPSPRARNRDAVVRSRRRTNWQALARARDLRTRHDRRPVGLGHRAGVDSPARLPAERGGHRRGNFCQRRAGPRLAPPASKGDAALGAEADGCVSRGVDAILRKT